MLTPIVRCSPQRLSAGAVGVGWQETLARFVAANSGRIAEALRVTGALVLTDVALTSAADFAYCAHALLGGYSDYAGGNSPRSSLGDGVYTSTEYPSEYEISLHNELSYSSAWPERILFGCVTPPAEGGETTIGDSRSLLRHVSSSTVSAFERTGIRYVRNLHRETGPGRTWPETFGTSDPAEVEHACRRSGTACVWDDDGNLRLTSVRPATATHPGTGERVWFNQAEQFHPSALPAEQRSLLEEWYGPDADAYPQNATFGDGAPIPEPMLTEVRAVAATLTVAPRWQAGSMLLLDNVLTCHGRKPFAGARLVLVAMR